jgi:hypothetical protein
VKRVAATALVLALAPLSANADEAEKSACLAAHEAGQIARRDGYFDRARARYAECTRGACPEPVRKRCAELAERIEAVQPTVIVVARDAHGNDIGARARLSIDGAPPGDVPATALRLDPGEHLLRLEVDGHGSLERRVVLREGERDRRIELIEQAPRRPADSPSTPTTSSRRTPVAAWALAGVSGVALAGAAATSAIGWSIRSHLETTCSPSCSDDQVRPLRVLWPVSFVALGVGVAAGVVATLMFLSPRGQNDDRARPIALDGALLRF